MVFMWEPMCEMPDRCFLREGKGLKIPSCVVVQSLQEVLAPAEAFQRLRPGRVVRTGEYMKRQRKMCLYRAVSLKARIAENLPEEMEIPETEGLLFYGAGRETSLEAFVAQFTKEQLARIVRGEGMCNPMVTPGTASAFGGTAPSLYRYGIPAACTADGPSGIRMDSGLQPHKCPSEPCWRPVGILR